MRMWMVDPKTLCDAHLLGEHVETHMFIGTIRRGVSVRGYVRTGLMEPSALLTRHNDLAREMERRGWTHASPIGHSRGLRIPRTEWRSILAELSKICSEFPFPNVEVGVSAAELCRRCVACRSLTRPNP